ncbi:MAG: DUF1667 domain-containing protein [Bacillales bacterium]|nr:DUF1667 domain-containing protein [Bacillales bacterium]
MKELICIACPRGCHLQVNEETFEVKGNTCPRGAVYGVNEIKNPVRVITSTVKIKGSDINRLPVKTDKAIAKGLMFDVIKLLDDVVVTSPVNIGDVILENILGTDVNIVACKKM